MGRTPMIAPLIKDFVPLDDMLSYAEACLRVYNRYGRRDNIYKARIKILIHELGADEYRRQVEEEFKHVKSLGIDPPKAEFDRIARAIRAAAARRLGARRRSTAAIPISPSGSTRMSPGTRFRAMRSSTSA